MTTITPPAGLDARSARRAPSRLTILALLAIAGAGSFACKKKEVPAGAASPDAGAGTASPAAAAPTPGPAPGPAIQQAAQPGQVAWGNLKTPSDAAVDGTGRIWIADQGNSAVRVFDAAGGFLGGWGALGSGPYGLKEPCGIAVHGDDVYLADTYNTGVELFSLAGQRKATSAAGLYNPHDVAVGPDGKVWIADTGNDRIIVSDHDLANPRPIGKHGAGPEEFSIPASLVVGPSGRVYVADVDNKRIQVLDGEGRFRAQWKFAGWGPDGEGYLDVDADDTLYASDAVGNAVVQIDRNGREVRRWVSDDAGEKFVRPRGVALDRKNRTLYVVNAGKNSVSKLKLSPAK
ncbi:MAG: NHL repeat-containing protein [Acidobacteriota bacterium]